MSEDDRNTTPAPPLPEEEITRPEGYSGYPLDPGISVITNLLDSKIGAFLDKLDIRDEAMRKLVVEVLNQAMLNHTDLERLTGLAEQTDIRSRNSAKDIGEIRSDITEIQAKIRDLEASLENLKHGSKGQSSGA